MAAISIGIPITLTNTNHKLTTSMKATKATNSREKSATELEEVKEKKETNFQQMKCTDFKICTKTKQRIKCNEIKGEEHEETVEFFLTIYHS